MIFGPYLSSVLRLLLPAEQRVDLDAADTALTTRPSPDASLLLGRVLLCRGRIKRAREVLAQAAASQESAADIALAGAYELLAELAEFGACRDWGPRGIPLEVTRRWSLSGWVLRRDAWSRQLPRLPDAVAQEAWFVSEIVSLPAEVASAASPDAVRPIWGRLSAALERVNAGTLRPELTLGVLLVFGEALRLVDQRPDALDTAGKVMAQARAAGDRVGEALCALLMNGLATTSRTVPEVMDLFAGDTARMRRVVMEALEEGPLPPLPSDVKVIFEGRSTARTLFEQIDWPIGLATAQVQAASWITRAKPPDVVATFELMQLTEALKGFTKAHDDAGVQLVQCRLLAVAVEQNHPLEGPLQRARDIGTWGRESGSFSFALGLGFFLLAITRWWRRRQNLACAMRAISLATALFDALEAPVASAEAAMEEADLLATNWEATQAVPALQHAFDGFVGAFTAMGTPQGGYLQPWQQLRQRIAYAGTTLAAVSGSPRAVARVQEQFTALKMPGAPA